MWGVWYLIYLFLFFIFSITLFKYYECIWIDPKTENENGFVKMAFFKVRNDVWKSYVNSKINLNKIDHRLKLYLYFIR